jgi:anti-sigma B factor antagonist
MSGGSRRVHQTAVPGPWTVVVKLPAEVDFSNQGLVQATFASALASRPKLVVADGTGTGFCDCAAIHALITAHHKAVAAGAQLRVVITDALVRRVLELTGADQILLVYPSLVDAHRMTPAAHNPGKFDGPLGTFDDGTFQPPPTEAEKRRNESPAARSGRNALGTNSWAVPRTRPLTQR